jgi:exopolyphosphatase/guanosine-5'-triphosphate,3'-diphosphate pyrophosphatase
MRGIIDIGSNTVRLVMYRGDRTHIERLFSNRFAVGLASYIDEDNVLSDEGIARTVEVLDEFAILLSKIDNPPVTAIATAGLRNIANSDEAVELIADASGIPITLLSGEEEAFYVSYAVLRSMEQEPLLSTDDYLVVDIGGGSTELVLYGNGVEQAEASLPVGSLNQYLRHVDFLLPTRENRCAIEAEVKASMDRLWTGTLPRVCTIAGVGGSIRAALRLYNHHHDLDGENRIMSTTSFDGILGTFDPDDRESVIRLTQLAPDRIHTLLPGMIILHAIIESVGAASIGVSSWGVREGYLLYQLEQEAARA